MSSDAAPGQRWQTAPQRRRWNTLFRLLCLGALLFATLLLVILLVTLIKNGARGVNREFLTSFSSRIPSQAGIRAALGGSVLVVAVSSIIAIPVGVAAAIYLQEFTTRKTRFTRFLQVNIANLAGVPSIIYGLLGLAIFVRTLALDRTIIAGALTMAVLILPTVILVSQEALSAVPKSYRDAATALGCSHWQTIRHHVLPAAGPGIITGIILSVSRALGESAPLITIGAVQYISFAPTRLGDKFTVLPIQIFDWATRPQQGYHDKAAAAIVVLMAILLLLNSVAIIFRARSRVTRA